MKNIFSALAILLYIFLSKEAFAGALIGEISKADYITTNKPQVIDIDTKMPITGAAVSIPSEFKKTFTDANGVFNLFTQMNGNIILSVTKEGYKPFSKTINSAALNSPLKIELQKISPYQVVIEDSLIHLGDNSFSYNSANASEFKTFATGPVFEKEFYLKSNSQNKPIYIIFGSLLGLDTLQALRMGQNGLSGSYSTPTQVFVNGIKIGELKINGDNQKLPIPKNILHTSSKNTLKIKTGVNKDNTAFVDYDDIEIVNLIIDAN